MVRKRLFVGGRVQGVFFRESCAREARRLGLCGFVRNLPDGRVEVLVEGAPDAVAELVRFCGHGPPQARVLSLEESEEASLGDRSDFSVLR